MRPCHLTTARLGFGTWSDDDLPLAMALWADDRVTRLIGGPFPEARVRDRLALEIANQAAHGYAYWPVFRLDDGDFVGCCGLRPVPGRPTAVELGFHLRPEHWGHGFATEAARAALERAFTAVGAEAVVAGHHPQNEVSRHVLLRLGFRSTGAQLYPPTGLQHPSYEMTAAEFAALRGPEAPRPA